MPVPTFVAATLSAHHRRQEEGGARGNDEGLACIPDVHPGYISWEQLRGT